MYLCSFVHEAVHYRQADLAFGEMIVVPATDGPVLMCAIM